MEQEIHKQGEGEAMVGEALLSDTELGIKAGTVVLPDIQGADDPRTLRARLALI